jgi:toxin-antitoxin system PIN domain toxin
MRALLDVNVLIALLDSDHVLHARAMAWFEKHSNRGWASCPITQNGCVRIMCGSRYPKALPAHAVIQRLATASKTLLHEFWPDDLTLLDASVFDTSRIHSPKQITDVYLLALAVKHRGILVTFDQQISVDAVHGAAMDNLVQL